MQTLSHLASVRATLPPLVAALVLLGAARADEGVLLTGERLKGKLTADGRGRLLFQPRGHKPPLALEQIDHVGFPARRLPPLRTGAAYRVLLCGGQQLTGELLGLGPDQIELRTAWSERIAIPRPAAVAVTHAPGFVTVFVDDFESDLQAWRLQGSPVLTAKQYVSGRRCLCFNTPGQQAEHTLRAPLAAGRAGINFQDRAGAGGLAWQLEAEFGGSPGWLAVRVGVDPRAGNYTAEVSGAAAGTSRLPRQDGWHRLNMEFSVDTLVLSIDDDILWSCRQPGSGGALRRVCLTCAARPAGTGGRGEVFFDDFSLARAVAELPHPGGDPEQDELWLLSGDQLFGSVAQATGRTIQLCGRFGPRSVSWGEVRGIYLRRQGTPARKSDGKSVRVWLRPGIGFEPDVLEGTVRRLDHQRLALGHEQLGELAIDRQRLRRLKTFSEESSETGRRLPP